MVTIEEEATAPVVSSARAKAEARRRRILDSASDRLGVVTGLPTALPTTTTTPETATTSEETTTEDASASTSEPTPAPKTSSTGSARLAAMRRRRFKKASEDAARAESEGPAAVATPEAAPTETTTTAPAEPPADPPAEPTKPVETAPSTAEPSIVMSEGDSKEAPKKYLGVAKMRRRQLAEKKAAAQQQQDSATAGTDADAAGTDTTGQVALVAPAPFVRPARFPIYMHLLTALLLFASGIGMGFHSATTINTNTSDVIVLWGMTPVQEGIGIVSRFSKSSSAGDDDVAMRDLLQHQKDASLLTGQEEDDEFSSGKPKGVDAAEGGERVHVNLDPIFQVDLDAVTSGPGLLMMLARWAVVMHRLFLSAVFYGPKRFLSNLLTLPMILWASPPWVFVFSLVLRFWGKHVLRGGLPDLDATGNLVYTNTSGGGGENSKNLDLVDMAVRTAKEWIAKSFPNVVMIITVFMDARTDMYIVLCGLLIGLVLPLFSQQQQQSVPITNGLDEL